MEIESDLPSQKVVLGVVKWFSATKGFGFVVSPDCTQDILLHSNVLRVFGQSSVVEGTQIKLVVQDTKRGAQAVEVLEIETVIGTAPLADILALEPDALAALPLEAARVKWFDRSKGFGFANVFGCSDDIFIHIEVVRQSGFSELLAGEAVCLKVLDGARGRMAVALLSWESALPA